jgi:hypothetical protein
MEEGQFVKALKAANGGAVERALQTIVSPSLREILLYWDSLRRDLTLPGWRDIDPLDLRRHLPILWAWKYDRAGDLFTGRLAGESITAVFGESLRNRSLEDFFKNRGYEDIKEQFHRVVDELAIYVGRGAVFDYAGHYGSGERIIMPLADDGTHPDGLIGATTYAFASAGDPATPQSQEEIQFFPL